MQNGNIIPAAYADQLAPAIGVVRALRDAGHQALLAGGAVRDLLLGREPRDVDVATSARPEEVQQIFGDRCREVGKAFGVILVPVGNGCIEVATFRRDLGYSDGRRPDAVAFSSPEEDARRRDFTINGLFYDPLDARLIDFVGGRDDLAHERIRAIGDPAARFAEDYLRMLRAVRFAATLAFDLDPATERSIRAAAERIKAISAERVQAELTRLLLEAPRAGAGLHLLRRTGLLAHLLPDIDALAGVEQPPAFHPEGDVFTHTALMLDAMERPTLTLAYAVLLHDVGKGPTAVATTEPDGSIRMRFNHHASVGAEMAERILAGLKMPVRHTEAIVHCVRNHMRFMDVRNMRKSTLRRLMGARTFPVELELHRLDCLCSHGDLSNHAFLVEHYAAFREEPALPPPWITGHDLLALGVREGPQVGAWMQAAYDAQLEERFRDREALLGWLRKELAEVDPPSP